MTRTAGALIAFVASAVAICAVLLVAANALIDDDPPTSPAPSAPAWTASCDGPVRLYHNGRGEVTAAVVIGSTACEQVGE